MRPGRAPLTWVGLLDKPKRQALAPWSYNVANASRWWPNCGCFVIIKRLRKYIPLVEVEAYSVILNNASRTTLTQTFVNPQKDRPLEELIYGFPLYDDASVVSFTCTVNGHIIHGRVKERQKARETYDEAMSQGHSTSLLDQSVDAGDAFTMRISNVPPKAKVKVEIIYLSELRNDAEVNGIRFSLPRWAAPRYGSAEMFPTASGQLDTAPFDVSATVDILMSRGSIRAIKSTSHPIAVQLGSLSTDGPTEAEESPRKASVSVVLGNAHMDKDFVLQIAAANLGDPCALLETHPSIPNQRTLMITLVPKFSLPPEDPEIIFIGDRIVNKGSKKRFSLMGARSDGQTSIPALTNSLNTLLRRLPFGLNFNVHSFGSRQVSKELSCVAADKSTVAQAIEFSNSFFAESKGVDMSSAFEHVFRNRNMRKNLEIFFLTSNPEPGALDSLFGRINHHVAESRGSIRIFSLGVGPLVSHALVEGVARAGNGFAQFVGDDEKAEKKLVRMLSCSMMPHITDYALEIKYRQTADDITAYYDGHGLVGEKIVCVADENGTEVGTSKVPSLETAEEPGQKPKKKTSLFDRTINDYEEMGALSGPDTHKKLHPLPDIPTPASLQTPYQIPPLYPFSRSSVYAMLSGPRIPETVTLRGTFIQGLSREELELEIPITIMPERDQMIHQLAARKAAKELEEGRGWIFHAKDFYTGHLLVDKYRGCFSDLVKREAVRLCTTYQVGGKWCSFVAVEGNDEGTQGRKTDWESISELPADDLTQPWIGGIRDVSELPNYSSSISGMSEIDGKEYSPTESFKAVPSINKGLLRRRPVTTPNQYHEEIQRQGATPMPGGGYQTSVGNYALFDIPPVGDAQVGAPPCYAAAVPSGQKTKAPPITGDQKLHSDLDLLLGDTNKSTPDPRKIPPGRYNISEPPRLLSRKLFVTPALHNELERDFMPSRLVARDFSKCREPWALSAIQAWLRDVAGGGLDLRIQDVKDALRHLFTSKVSKMNVAEAKALSNQVVADMLRARALVPDEEWIIFGQGKVSGVLWQMTGSGCYGPRLHKDEVSGRCYHSRCALGPILLSSSTLPYAHYQRQQFDVN